MIIEPTKKLGKVLTPEIREAFSTQYAALCWRIRRGKPRILLITSRDTGRWVMPKGWPMNGKSAADAAAREAWEEAGVEGRISERCIGLYTYPKIEGDDQTPCAVLVFPLKVKNLRKRFPEADERDRKWFGRKKAAEAVQEPELREMLRRFDPKKLRL